MNFLFAFLVVNVGKLIFSLFFGEEFEDSQGVN